MSHGSAAIVPSTTLDEDAWDDLLSFIEERRVIPIVGPELLLTNLTGHPTLVLPNGYRKQGDVETPFSLTFTGRLFGETELLAVGHAYQQATGHHLRHPPMEKVTAENAGG